MNFTVIYEPNEKCVLELAEKCEEGIFKIKPADSNNWDSIVKGCKNCFPLSDPSDWLIEFTQYGKPTHRILQEDETLEIDEVIDKNGMVWKKHYKKDGRPVINRKTGEQTLVQSWIKSANGWPKRPKVNTIIVDLEEAKEYVARLSEKL